MNVVDILRWLVGLAENDVTRGQSEHERKVERLRTEQERIVRSLRANTAQVRAIRRRRRSGRKAS